MPKYIVKVIESTPAELEKDIQKYLDDHCLNMIADNSSPFTPENERIILSQCYPSAGGVVATIIIQQN